MIEYHPSYAARAHDLCMSGLNELEIANVLGISVGAIRAWRQNEPSFEKAWMDGTVHANNRVVAALFKKAIGYDKIKWKETKDGMFQELVHIEPHFQSCAFWLTNKMPEQWKTRVEHEIGDGGNIVDALTEKEAARRVAFALAKAIYQPQEQEAIEHGATTDPSETK